jgi:hypothetical protein
MIEDARIMERARFRILMRTPNIMWSPSGGGTGLRRFSSAIGSEICTILQANFGEYPFHALR